MIQRHCRQTMPTIEPDLPRRHRIHAQTHPPTPQSHLTVKASRTFQPNVVPHPSTPRHTNQSKLSSSIACFDPVYLRELAAWFNRIASGGLLPIDPESTSTPMLASFCRFPSGPPAEPTLVCRRHISVCSWAAQS